MRRPALYPSSNMADAFRLVARLARADLQVGEEGDWPDLLRANAEDTCDYLEQLALWMCERVSLKPAGKKRTRR